MIRFVMSLPLSSLCTWAIKYLILYIEMKIKKCQLIETMADIDIILLRISSLCLSIHSKPSCIVADKI